MLRKLVTGILALAMCASTMAALPQAAHAAQPDPMPIIVIDPEDPKPPVEPGKAGEPGEPGEPPAGTNEVPDRDGFASGT